MTAVPAIRKKVHFDIWASGSSIRTKRELHRLKHIDYQLVTRFVVPELHLQDEYKPCLVQRRHNAKQITVE